MPQFTAPIPLSVYVHIPWCVRKCPYCDFNSHAIREDLPERRYVDAVLADLEAELPGVWGRRIESVFIGGGTPSLFSPEMLDRLLSGIAQRLPLRPDTEITLEANPGTFEQGKFAEFRALGINRLSIGIQSFDDTMLERIGRIHNGFESRRAVEIAQAAGFDNLNLDLMFGLPGQTRAQALADVRQAVQAGPAHISYYQLTLEPNTLFHVQPPVLPDDDARWDMQEAGQEALAAGGYTQYEVSAYARPGRRCRHNLNYWEFGDYLGIGAGAHGKHSDAATGAIMRYRKQKQPAAYMETAAGGGAALARETLAPAHLPFEFMLNALRLTEGFEARLFAERAGLAPETIAPQIDRAVARELLTRDGESLRPTELGRRFLNDLIETFLPDGD
ncbi:MAG TPA: oxygen-independent coproporphyrinogen III oxidase-like protein [Thioalkalivibrio sp.]|nr:oxygen-independent coproporphyrinogen III oxidase-like protein [Thioalkalivibrio sp.]